mgnify:CR=1 FL=1
MAKLSNDFIQAELQTVFNRERGACIMLVNKEDLLYDSSFYMTVKANRCYINPLNYTPVSNTYSNEVQLVKPGEDYQVRVIINNFSDYPDLSQIGGYGKILGYPDCCIKFFENYWNQKHYRDMIPCMEGIQFIELGKNQVYL